MREPTIESVVKDMTALQALHWWPSMMPLVGTAAKDINSILFPSGNVDAVDAIARCLRKAGLDDPSKGYTEDGLKRVFNRLAANKHLLALGETFDQWDVDALGPIAFQGQILPYVTKGWSKPVIIKMITGPLAGLHVVTLFNIDYKFGAGKAGIPKREAGSSIVPLAGFRCFVHSPCALIDLKKPQTTGRSLSEWLDEQFSGARSDKLQLPVSVFRSGVADEYNFPGLVLPWSHSLSISATAAMKRFNRALYTARSECTSQGNCVYCNEPCEFCAFAKEIYGR